jgi:hypothetical protein
VQLSPRKLGHSLADPFIVSADPDVHLLAEEFSHDQPGRIVAIDIGMDATSPRQVRTGICPRTEHTSYPYLFTDSGSLYCLPECHQSNRSTLYRYDGTAFHMVRDLLTAERVTDGSILFDGSLYWLLCGLEDDCDQVNLYLFYAPSLDADWCPHPLNPVKTDVTSARPAGQFLVANGQFFRPSQDCSKSYGSALAINRIDELSPTAFRETRVATIRPEAISRSCFGVHTLSFAQGMVAIDAKSYLVGWKPFYIRGRRRAAALLGRVFPSHSPALARAAAAKPCGPRP